MIEEFKQRAEGWYVLKDPDAVLDYRINWAVWLTQQGNDTIASSQWIVPGGITLTSQQNTTTTATVWLSGGTAGSSYLVTNRIVTTGGRTEDQSFTVEVRAA